jgi:hypothetical protein
MKLNRDVFWHLRGARVFFVLCFVFRAWLWTCMSLV